MTKLSYILFLIFIFLSITLIPGNVHSSGAYTQTLTLEPAPLIYQASLTTNPEIDKNLPAAKIYHQELTHTVSKVLKKKIKEKLYKQVFPKDIMQELYEENAIELKGES